jgi:hypothetical protein
VLARKVLDWPRARLSQQQGTYGLGMLNWLLETRHFGCDRLWGRIVVELAQFRIECSMASLFPFFPFFVRTATLTLAAGNCSGEAELRP